MEQKAKEPGIRGVVADIVLCRKDYEVAIETALGGSIQNIVTDNEQTAKRMIGFLKQNVMAVRPSFHCRISAEEAALHKEMR